jgi:tRNA(Ile)-lysidine synthase
VLTQNALPEPLVRRFAGDFLRLSNAGTDDRIGIAVSGGPDSVALLLLAHAAFPERIEAATIDHRLRAASVDEAQFVARLCASRAIAHMILTLEPLAPGNVSAAARLARYAALGDWMDARNLDWLLTAHHADDQRETVIMRLNRGAGVSGLSGVRARQGRIVRPLLSWRRADLTALVAQAGIVAIDDPSNQDDRYDRARLRKVLASADWLDPLAVADSAAALAAADTAVEWATDRVAHDNVALHDKIVQFDRHGTDAPDEIIRRVTLRCLRRIDARCAPRGDALSRIIATLESGSTATIGKVLARGGKIWTFRAAPPRRSPDSNAVSQ